MPGGESFSVDFSNCSYVVQSDGFETNHYVVSITYNSDSGIGVQISTKPQDLGFDLSMSVAYRPNFLLGALTSAINYVKRHAAFACGGGSVNPTNDGSAFYYSVGGGGSLRSMLFGSFFN